MSLFHRIMGFVSLNVLLYVVQIHGLENLALHQPTWEQNPWPDKMRDFGSENAVDGMYTDRGANGGQCTISVDGVYNATLGVDLGRVVSISHIDIYYRTDNLGYSYYMYTGRVAGFFVYVSNTTSKDDGYLCYHDKSTIEGTLSSDQHINCTLHGRYVIYYNERKPGVNYPTFYSKYAYHELCELEVYGCNGTYGEDCIYPCPTNCQDRRCDINTGLCFSCVPGYNGPKFCNNNTYGPECALKCGNCSNGETCHHINGTCFNGCAEGALGDTCQGGCQSGYYGQNCSHRCSENCIVTSQCNRFTGRCDGGCKPGWRENTCNQICNNNTYGPACALNCGNCSNGGTCHHINGTCLHGCARGTTGDTCQEGCQSGYYGRDCSHRCSENCIVNNHCDRVTGRCDGGCKQGWTGNTCDQIRATNTQPCSCTESYTIVIVVVSVLIVVTGSLINFVIWKRNAAKFSRMSLGNMPQPTSKREEKDHQYTELEEVDKSKTYEEIHSYSN
nr:multiple epidermal growth factor-like domains protein 11 isoform X2 [Crassostrea gigas]